MEEIMDLEQILADLTPLIVQLRKRLEEQRQRERASGAKYSRSVQPPDERHTKIEPPNPIPHRDTIWDVIIKGLRKTLHRKPIPEPAPEPIPLKRPAYLDRLTDMLNQRNMSNADFYKKAHIDRRHFSKILNNYSYIPSRNTVFLMCFALELNWDEMQEFLNLFGYSYCSDREKDLVVAYFLENEIYDIDLCNEALIKFGIKPLENLSD